MNTPRTSMVQKIKNNMPARSQAGFTLIELMVSLTLFVIVVLAAVSSLYSVNNAAREVSTMRSVLDNLDFAVESMSRTIRTGSSIVCGGTANGNYAQTTGHNCRFGIDSPADRISIHSTVGVERDVEFRLAASTNGGGQVEKRVFENGTWKNWVALTAPEIDIERLTFYVNGADSNDTTQPSVIMFIQGVTATTTQTSAPFAIQLFISQRAAE